MQSGSSADGSAEHRTEVRRRGRSVCEEVDNTGSGCVSSVSLSSLSHLNVAVRTSFAQQLHLLADRLGAAAVLTGGRSFTQCFLTAANKMSVDAAAEVRSVSQEDSELGHLVVSVGHLCV